MRSFHRILVPVDFSDCSRRALAYAVTLARVLQASVHVVHAAPPPLPPPALPRIGAERLRRVEAMDAREDELLLAFLADCDLAGVSSSRAVEVGDAADVILDLAPSYDLVIMGTHGRGALGRLLLGGVASRVVRMAPCPVLTIR